MTVFAMLGAIDRILGNRFGIGKEFEKGIMMLGVLMMSMTGMIIIAPAIADVLRPALSMMSEVLPIDPSVIPGLLFANDMGGASLALELAKNSDIGYFNGLIVAAMMGATISFSIPCALGIVQEKQHREVLMGLMCGIVTIPIGCAVSGIVCRIALMELLCNLLPLIFISGIIIWGLLKNPDLCVKLFRGFGQGINILITIGLGLGILRFLTGIEIIKNLATLEEGAMICLNACAVMSGAFPFMYVMSKVLAKVLHIISKKLDINGTAALGLLSSLATSVTTFGMMKDMDDKGVVINSAFAVSGAFVFAGHLAFTMAFQEDYVGAMIIGKLTAGVLAVWVATRVYKSVNNK
jgi:ethanolamine transporter